ncbi:hypothetical protein U9M48_017388 [Paspalum notatum var. saurae]|uniref:Thaumatin-like protein n=1 Tax=Paspalum notatum var. saurae TaxID=547442 RepID=A0AAQ3WP98_PASNO
MASLSLAKSSALLLAVALAVAVSADAITFNVINHCQDTLWPAALPGGGAALDPGKTWTFEVPAGTAHARVWARTGCHFDGGGRGACETGDCGGALACAVSGTPPATLAEYTLGNPDYVDISLVDGFNVPMSFQCAGKGPSCAADVNARCPGELKVPGGCDSACAKFGGDTYCCQGQFKDQCPPTNYKFFKGLCPDAYSYAKDDQTSTFNCPQGANYDIVLCP